MSIAIKNKKCLYGTVKGSVVDDKWKIALNSPEQVALYIVSEGSKNTSVQIENEKGEVLLDTAGIYIAHCPNIRLKMAIAKYLNPMQDEIEAYNLGLTKKEKK